jgi:hypothetical protein
MTQVRVHTAKIEAQPIAYIVMTQTTMPVIYGTFATQDEAVSHAQKLEYADVLPIYEPTIH